MKLSHLKVFGCVSYVHISDHVKNKLDSKSLKCTFISYGDEKFGYRLWDDQNKKAIKSRDVIFTSLSCIKTKIHHSLRVWCNLNMFILSQKIY